MPRHRRRKLPQWLGKVARVGAAIGTAGASEVAIAGVKAAKSAGDGVRRLHGPARGALAVLTAGGSEVLALGSKALSRRGHRGTGPSPHPADHGPPQPRPGRAFLERRHVARRLAGLHGPVLPARPKPAGQAGPVLAVHPPPGRLHVERRAVARVRARLPHRKL